MNWTTLLWFETFLYGMIEVYMKYFVGYDMSRYVDCVESGSVEGKNNEMATSPTESVTKG